MVTTAKPAYAAAQVDVTLTIAGVASDPTLLAGQASSVIDNSSNLYWNGFVRGRIRTGTSPTGGVIELWAWGEYDAGSYPDGITGTNAAKTLTSANVKYAGLVSVWSCNCDTASDRDYPIPPIGLASIFRGGIVPKKFGFFLTHSTGAALNATAGNHKLSIEFYNPQSV